MMLIFIDVFGGPVGIKQIHHVDTEIALQPLNVHIGTMEYFTNVRIDHDG